MLQRLRSRYREQRLNVWRLEGKERCSNEPLNILYAGHELNKNYISYLAYGTGCKETYLGRAWIGKMIKSALRSDGDQFFIIETAERDYDRFNMPGSFYIPCWVDGEIDLDQFDALVRGESVRGDMRRISKYGLHFEVTKDRDKFKLFYHQMYKPYILNAHGNRAALMSYEAMMTRYVRNELVLIKRDGKYIAGSNLVYQDGNVRAWSLGVLDGDYRYVKEGAIGALYYYKMKYLHEQGYRHMEAGASRAFLKDGVLCFKKKWDMGLTSGRSSGFWIKPIGGNEGVAAFLGNNPFIYQKDDGLHGVVFLTPEQADMGDMEGALRKLFGMRGMSGIDMYLLGGSYFFQASISL